MKTLKNYIPKLTILLIAFYFFNFNSLLAQVNLNEGLVAYYPFNGNAYDESGNGNNGTVHGATLTADRFGNPNSAYEFDGVDDYIDVGNMESNVYTFNVWLKPDETITISSPSIGFIDFTELIYRLCLCSSTSLVEDETICIQDVRNQYEYRTAVTNLNITHAVWHMITLAWNTGENRYDIYFDGILRLVTKGNSSAHVPLMSCNNLKFGILSLCSASSFDGKIDDIRIYNRALNEQEIQTLYNEGQSNFTCGQPFTDIRDGQIYNTVPIGNQCWIKENLNIGTRIDGSLNQTNNGTIEKYCYENNPDNCIVYGGMYQWDEMMQYTTQEIVKGICPESWHIPTDDEWNILEGTVDSQYPVGDPEWLNTGRRGFDAGGNLKMTGTNYWNVPNEGATNQSQFTALPGGKRNSNGSFDYLGSYSYAWTSTMTSTTSAYYHRYEYNTAKAYRTVRNKGYGLGVRCVKNSITQGAQLQGVILDINNSQAIMGASIILTHQSAYFQTTSNDQGEYSFENLPTGTYNITVSKQSYQTKNRMIELTQPITYQEDFYMNPVSSNSLVINDQLTAFADNITQSPADVYTLNGNVNINGILYFDGTLKIDKRPNLDFPEITGSCGFYAYDIQGVNKDIYPGGEPFIYITDGNELLAKDMSYCCEIPIIVGGFSVKLAGMTIHENGDNIYLHVIPQLTFPLKEILSGYMDNEIRYVIDHVSFSVIYSHLGGTDYEANIHDLEGNFAAFKVEDLYIHFDTYEELFEGGLSLQIPGIPKEKNPEYDGIQDDYGTIDSLVNNREFEDVPVEIVDEDGNLIGQTTIKELTEIQRAFGLDFLKIGMQIGFVHGGIDSFIITLAVKIPLGPTGLFITEMTGGVKDLQTSDWMIVASVDIEIGVEIPGLGPPIKFDDLGVEIQPMTYFKGSGAFLIFNYEVANGYIELDMIKKSITGEGNLNLYDIVIGNVYLCIKSEHFNAGGNMTLKTPGGLPWYLSWANNKVLGSASVDIYNETLKARAKIWIFTLATKIVFSNPDFPWCHLYVGTNFSDMLKIWKGIRDGNQSIDFLVPENTSQFLIVAGDTINPVLFDFTLTSPFGQVYDSSNSFYMQFEDTKQTIMAINNPQPGTWSFYTDYAGDITLETKGLNQEPTALVTMPDTKKKRSNQISLDFTDYSDTLNVMVFFDTDRKHFDGVFIQEFELVNNATVDFDWNNEDLQNGEYFIYCRIDDGKNSPVMQYAPGSIWVENDTDVETPQNFSAVQEGDSVRVQWDKPTHESTFAAIVYYKNISDGFTGQISTVDTNVIYIQEKTAFIDTNGIVYYKTNLEWGQEYEIWCCFINNNGTYGPISNVENLVFSSGSKNNPPYFTLNLDSCWIFVVDEPWEFVLSANDADGNNLTFNVPADTLGMQVNDTILSWMPLENQKGVYNILLTVTDGVDTDSIYQEIVVYTQEQVDIKVAFSSLNLYEDDNMFIKINNYFCPDYYQSATLTNTRTQEQTPIECRRTDDFEYIGQFELSFINRSEIAVSNGDTIQLTYTYNNEEYTAIAYYDSLPQPSDHIPPGTITDIEIIKLANNEVQLQWTATGNDGDQGKAYKYDIRYAYEPIISEGIYFTAHLIENYPYPSPAGEKDSLIINLNNLFEVTLYDTVYFSIKAEDEMQNRGELSNSPWIKCLLSPENLKAEIVDVYKIELNWTGVQVTQKGETIFQHYNLYKKINEGDFFLYESGITENTFTDNLKYYPDGTYQYAVQAIYETGASDTIFSEPVELNRFVDVNIICSLDDTTNYEGISFEMTGIDTVYSQVFSRITNIIGLILLDEVYKSNYAVKIFKEGYKTLLDTITVTDTQYEFCFMLPDSTRTHAVNIPKGWSGLSSFINPNEKNLDSLLRYIINELIILQNDSGMFWPGQNINTLGDWDTHQGYKIKVTDSVELTIAGTRENDKTLQLATGWNLIPVLSECTVNVVELFNGTDLIIVKEVAGWRVYWPQFGINTLGVLEPGKAYFVLMNTETTITFPECTRGMTPPPTLHLEENGVNRSEGSPLLLQEKGPGVEVTKTPITHTIAIPFSAVQEIEIGIGNFLGSFDTEGNCYGIIFLQGENTATTIYGDDPTTTEKDGFIEGEKMFFRLYNPENNKQEEIFVSFDPAYPNNNGCFAGNGLSVILKMNVGSTLVRENKLSEIEIYPNPANDVIFVKYNGINVSNITLMNIHGQNLREIKPDSGLCEIDISKLKKGMYFIKINCGDTTLVMRFIKQ